MRAVVLEWDSVEQDRLGGLGDADSLSGNLVRGTIVSVMSEGNVGPGHGVGR